MEYNHIYSETPIVAVGALYGRRVCAIDVVGAPKQRSVVALVVVASLYSRILIADGRTGRVSCAVTSWHDRTS